MMSDSASPTPAKPAVAYDRIAIAAALTSVVLWASAFVGIRAASVDYGAGSLALGRLIVGSLALAFLVARRGAMRPSRRDLVLIVAAGLLWFALYNVALNLAEQNVDAGTTSMLVNVAPIFLAVLAAIFLGEGFPPRLLAGLAIAFVGGAAIAVATTNDPVPGGNATLGIVLCLVSALAYAAAQILQKPVLQRLSAVQVTWMACTAGMLACLPFLPSLVDDLGTAQPVSTAWMLYLGLFPTAIGFTTWTFALGRSAAGRLGSMTYLVPPVVIVMAWLVLGEIPPMLAIAGGVLCIIGVIVARSRGSLAVWRRVPSPVADRG